MGRKKKKRGSVRRSKPKANPRPSAGSSAELAGSLVSQKFDKEIDKLSDQELKELLLINMYKLAMTRAQLEAVTDVLIKSKIADFEDIWKRTHENFKNTI